LHWNDVVLDCSKRIAKRGEWELFLSPTEFALLEHFLRNPEIVCTKAELLEHVWHDDGFRDENIVQTYITYLRRKTEVVGQRRIIQTAWGQGYVLSLEPS
jgi:DNA-binding response OmpR family regulator